jgi:hypothetical protein
MSSFNPFPGTPSDAERADIEKTAHDLLQIKMLVAAAVQTYRMISTRHPQLTSAETGFRAMAEILVHDFVQEELETAASALARGDDAGRDSRLRDYFWFMGKVI